MLDVPRCSRLPPNHSRIPWLIGLFFRGRYLDVAHTTLSTPPTVQQIIGFTIEQALLGFWMAAIPPTIIALLEYALPTAVIVFLGIVLINAFFYEVVKPRFYGEGLDLAPVMVILS